MCTTANYRKKRQRGNRGKGGGKEKKSTPKKNLDATFEKAVLKKDEDYDSDSPTTTKGNEETDKKGNEEEDEKG
jgi:hypothetical protein